ncbi:hypothetical protein NKH77_33670 [Streptomyces sp. M19]
MTEHPTSHNRRQAAPPAAAPATPAAEDAHGAVPDPRTSEREAATGPGTRHARARRAPGPPTCRVVGRPRVGDRP